MSGPLPTATRPAANHAAAFGVDALMSRGRMLALGGASLAVWLAVASPLASRHHQLLTAHMAEHMLLSLVAAPLFLVATSSLWSRLPRWQPRLAFVRAVGRALNHPIVCWSAAILVLIGWHLPFVFERAHHSAFWHAVGLASFLGSGLLFWWPVLQPSASIPRWPRWSLPLYLFFATLPCDVLSALLVFSDRVIYPVYLSSARIHGLSALQDQECAGALMWLCTTIAYGTPAAVITANVLSSPIRLVDHG